MRKSTLFRALSGRLQLISLIGMSFASMNTVAQDTAVPSTSAPVSEVKTAALPSDPKELMLLAAKVNGLTGDDVKPWHLKASYKLLDEKRSVTDQGTYEEFWVSKTKYKLIFTTKTTSRTEYGTEKGIFNSDKEEPVSTHDIRRQLLSPMPISQSLEQADFILKPTKMGDIQLNCLNRKNASGNPSGVTYCLDVQLPVLRGTAAPEGLERTARNGYVSFQGHYIAQDLQILYSSKESLTAHLDSIESLTTIDEAVFAPPSNAIPRSITSGVKIVTGATSVGFLIKKVDPIYPQSALIYHASGTVVIQTTIGKDGHTHDLHAISGPSELQQAALDAVKQWVYRPYLLNNEPVEVQTTVSIVFDIHR